MCGIVGLYLKNPKLQPQLGAMFKPMIIEMTNRGPGLRGRRHLPQPGEGQRGQVLARP